MTRKTIVYTYNGDGHCKPLLRASIEMLQQPELQKRVGPIEVRNTPGRNYEGAPAGYSFVGGGNACFMSLGGASNKSFWRMTEQSSKGYIGICAGSVLTCPVQRYEFELLEFPKKINTPVVFKVNDPLVDSAISLAPGVVGKLNYTSVAYEAEQISMERDSGMVMWDDERLQMLETQYIKSIVAVRGKKTPIFDALQILDCQGGLAHQVGLDSLIFDVSGAYGGSVKTIASVAQECSPAATGSAKLDSRHAFAFVHSGEGKFCIGGHPEAAFQFKPLYDHFRRDGFVPGCGAEPLVADMDNQEGAIKASQKQAITMLSEGLSALFSRKKAARKQAKPAASGLAAQCGGGGLKR